MRIKSKTHEQTLSCNTPYCSDTPSIILEYLPYGDLKSFLKVIIILCTVVEPQLWASFSCLIVFATTLTLQQVGLAVLSLKHNFIAHCFKPAM